MSNMNEESFISEIFSHPWLWERNHIWHKNTQKKCSTWNSIGGKFGISGAEAEKVFVSYRQKYIRMKKAEKKESRSGTNSQDPRQQWHLLSCLKFLDDVIVPRKSYSSMLRVNAPTIVCEEEESTNQSCDESFLTFYDIFDSTNSQPSTSHLSPPSSSTPPSPTSPSQVRGTLISPPPDNSVPLQEVTVFPPPTNTLPVPKKRKRQQDIDTENLLQAMTAPIVITQQPPADPGWNVPGDVKYFCMYIGEELAKMTEPDRKVAKIRLFNVLQDYTK